MRELSFLNDCKNTLFEINDVLNGVNDVLNGVAGEQDGQAPGQARAGHRCVDLTQSVVKVRFSEGSSLTNPSTYSVY